MRNVLIVLSFLAFFTLQSCENEVDLLAPWTEKMVVYGLLSPPNPGANLADTNWQYFKISRVFSNTGGAYANASKDSGSYTQNLNVKLERISGKTILETISLIPKTLYTKEPGIFPNKKEVLYVTDKPILKGSEYHLSVTNPQTGAGITAKTNTIGQFEIASSFTNEMNVNWYSAIKVQPAWVSCQYGKIYQVSVRFHYAEKSLHASSFVKKYCDWELIPQYSNTIKGGEKMSSDPLSAVTFYSQLLKNIQVEVGTIRTAGEVEFIFTAGNQEFSDYMDINKPSNGVVQDKPIYTNIEGGIGLFASRISYSVKKSLEKQSIDSLKFGKLTKNLGFQ